MKFYLRPRKILSLFRVVNLRAVPIYAWHSLHVLVRSLFARGASATHTDDTHST